MSSDSERVRRTSPVSPQTSAGGNGPSSSSAPPENPPEKTKQEIFAQNHESGERGERAGEILPQISSCFTHKSVKVKWLQVKTDF